MSESVDSGTFFSCVADKNTMSMKPRNIAIMMFCFFTSAALLVTLHLRSQMSGKTFESQWETTLQDLNSTSSAALLQSLHYDNYARQAAAEDDPSRKKLFLALAHSQRIHSQMCARAIKLFGGNDSTPPTPTLTTSYTTQNLAHSITSAHARHNASQGNAATRAIESGNRYVARIFIWIDGCNRRHIELLEHSNQQDDNAPNDIGYLVCPKCGNTYHTASFDVYCPFCRTHYSDFKRF